MCLFYTLPVEYLIMQIVSARIRRMGEGNVLTHDCLSVHRGVPTIQLTDGGTYLLVKGGTYLPVNRGAPALDGGLPTYLR